MIRSLKRGQNLKAVILNIVTSRHRLNITLDVESNVMPLNHKHIKMDLFLPAAKYSKQW